MFHITRVSGQGVYQTANELFFTARCVIVLVFDLSQITNDGNALKVRTALICHCRVIERLSDSS
jgi:hypothetical protein